MAVMPGEVVVEPPVPVIVPAAPSYVVVTPGGPPGPQGPAGPSGDPVIFVQGAPASTWIIAHGLGRLPASVQIVLTGGEVVDTDINVDVVNVVLTFAAPTAGTALIL